jgi:hypothetical protein
MNPIISRRTALQSLACGFGGLALADMLQASTNCGGGRLYAHRHR